MSSSSFFFDDDDDGGEEDIAGASGAAGGDDVDWDTIQEDECGRTAQNSTHTEALIFH